MKTVSEGNKLVEIFSRRPLLAAEETRLKFEVEEVVFRTFTQDPEQLRQWLKERNVRQVAMESTVLQSGKRKFELMLVHPSKNHTGF
jgi:hypothetical protein